MTLPPLLLLSPSRGFGGGIERVVGAVEQSWPGPVQRVDLYARGQHPSAAGNRPAQAAFARAALSAARRRPWGHIVCLHAGLLPVAVAAGLATRRPVALVAYGTEVWGPMSPVRRRLIHSCARLLAISSFTAKWLESRAGLSRGGSKVIRLPISRALAERALSARGGPRTPTLLTVSRLVLEHRYKGHFEVAKAWPLVRERLPSARWVIVGDGDDRPALERECARLGLASSAVFAGRLSEDQLADSYATASGLILPSVTDVDSRPPAGEGFGLVYAEAGAFGTPSIASTAGGGALDYVRHEETGLTVPPGEPRALAAAALRLLGEPDERDRLGLAARRRTSAQHLPAQFATRLVAALS